jgi:hypothetical protein
VQTQRIGGAGGHPGAPLGAAQIARGAGIKRCAIGVAPPRPPRLAFRHQPGDLRPALEGRIDETARCERRDRPAIRVEVLGLAAHRLLPGKPEPREVLVDRGFEFRPAARRIDVLDPQQQAAAGRARHVEIDQGGERMSEMEIAVRARRETKDGHGHCGHCAVMIAGL